MKGLRDFFRRRFKWAFENAPWFTFASVQCVPSNSFPRTQKACKVKLKVIEYRLCDTVFPVSVFCATGKDLSADMIGLLLGFLCGAVELFLLIIFVKRVTRGERLPIWLIVSKMVTLVFFFVPCALFFPNDLFWAATGASVVLVLGSIAIFVVGNHKEKNRMTHGEKGVKPE